MSFFEHLEELRWHLVRIIAAIFAMSIVAFFFKDFIFNQVILAPKEPYFVTNQFMCHLAEIWHKPVLCLNNNELQIVNLKISGQFVIHLTISIIAGALVSFPYTIYQIWRFLSPALYVGEKRISITILLAVNILFFLGVMMGYFMIVPISINFLSNYVVSDMVANTISLRSYISTISSIVFAGGIVFELPVLTYFLSKLGLLTPHTMRRYRKHAVVVILILGSILTPPDLVSQILISLPLLLLYEFSIRISQRIHKRMQ